MLCKLCLLEKELELSHSIPRAYISKIKENGKLVLVNENSCVTSGSFDPKEHMLCEDCEDFLADNYESYGIPVLRTRRNVVKHKTYISVNNINYKKYYLFLLSIFWRVSVSEIDFYNTVSNMKGLGDLMRYAIYNDTLKAVGGIRIDQIVKICIFRVVDTTGTIPDKDIKKTMSNFAQEVNDNVKQVVWYFVVEGFLIVYTILIGNDIHEHRYTKFVSQLSDSKEQRFQKKDIITSKMLINVYWNLLSQLKIE